MARDVVRMRGQITNFYKMRAQMQSVSMQMQVSRNHHQYLTVIINVWYRL